MIFLICFWIPVARILLWTFASMLFSDIGLYFSFFPFIYFLTTLSCFDSRMMLASQNEFECLTSFAKLWKNLSRIDVTYSLNFWYNSPVKPSGPGLLFVGRFLITVFISVLVMGLLRFSISSWFNFLKICPYLPSCPFYWQIVAGSSLL